MMHKTYKNHTLLLVTYLIFYNNPKGKIFFFWKNQRDIDTSVRKFSHVRDVRKLFVH